MMTSPEQESSISEASLVCGGRFVFVLTDNKLGLGGNYKTAWLVRIDEEGKINVENSGDGKDDFR